MAGAYWPVLGLVPGPGEVLGVGLVVLGVSVPMPPSGEPEVPDEELPDEAPPDMSVLLPDDVPDDELPLELPPEVPPDVPLELPPDVPLESEGTPDELPPVDEPPLFVPEGVPGLPVPPAELVPELPSVPEPESPPVMPAHAPSSIAQAIGNIHFVINHSR